MTFQKAKAKVEQSVNPASGHAVRTTVGAMMALVLVVVVSIGLIMPGGAEAGPVPLPSGTVHKAASVVTGPAAIKHAAATLGVSRSQARTASARLVIRQKAEANALAALRAVAINAFLQYLAVIHNFPYLACVRTRESEGEYGINTGNGYYGGYQFSQSTWDNTARHAGWLWLVGSRASALSGPIQDLMAWSLYQWQGTSPWKGGRYHC